LEKKMSETTTINLPAGTIMSIREEANHSTTLSFQFANGFSHSWNTGTILACTFIGAGVGVMIGAGTINPLVGSLVSTLVTAGCTYFVTENNSSGGGGGGDSGGGNDYGGGPGEHGGSSPGGSGPKIPGGYWQIPGATAPSYDATTPYDSHTSVDLVGIHEPAYASVTF
jgi:hypothetical protein